MKSASIRLQKLAIAHSDLSERLGMLHDLVRSRFPGISRIALALYDPQTDLLTTFASSNVDGVALQAYEARLSDVPSLLTLAQTHSKRVVQHIESAFGPHSEHTRWLLDRHYRSSYTLPVFHGQTLAAFLFFDAKDENAFSPEVLAFLDAFAGIITQLYLLRINAVNSLVGAVEIASGLARIRDVETGQHLQRMAAFARLIARGVAQQHGLSDELIEYIHLFAPLHDIGKVGIPDAVLLKPGRLDGQEWAVMQTHVSIGIDLVTRICEDLGLQDDLSGDIMMQVVRYHHERGDGSGYPAGLHLANIPITGRIVAVADVYDALAHPRPYKPAWDESTCLAELKKEAAAGRLDPDCVNALLAATDERRQILLQFAEPGP